MKTLLKVNLLYKIKIDRAVSDLMLDKRKEDLEGARIAQSAVSACKTRVTAQEHRLITQLKTKAMK